MVLHEARLLISVVIPVFNVAPYLRRCVESLLSQTFRGFELILVDDGSTDGSSDICDEYNNRYARVRALHYNNSGVSAARNRGIEAAQGEYISFVDADDWVEEGFLEAFANEIERRKAEGTAVDMVLQGFWNHEGCRIGIPYAFYGMASEIGSKLYCLEEKRLIGYVWNKVFRRAITEEYHVRFNPEIPIGEDFLFCMEAISHCQSMSVLSDAGYHYVFTGDKDYSFAAFVKRLNAFDAILSQNTFIPQRIVNKFQFQEFKLSIYVFHILYGEGRTREERIEFLRKTRKKSYGNPEIFAYKLPHPYKWLAVLVLYIPLRISDFLFQWIFSK